MKNFISKVSISRKAFSLIELSVVILILSIIVTGLLSINFNSSINNKIKKTNDNIAKIYQEMGAYLLTQNRLPCPAPIKASKLGNSSYSTASSSAGTCADVDGVYNLRLSSNSTTTDFVYGMVPVATLGLTGDFAEDGFGNKLGYIINKNFTSTSTFSSVDVSTKGIQVKKNSTILNTTNLGMFAIISYGQNKLGAFDANSIVKNSEPTNIEEINNSPYSLTTASPYNATIYSDNSTSSNLITLYSSSSSAIFDDVLFFKSRNDMVKDFNAFYLIPCPAISGTSDVTYAGTNMLWGLGKYNSVAISITACPTGWKATVKNPGRRCGELGVWEAGGANAAAKIAIPCT